MAGDGALPSLLLVLAAKATEAPYAARHVAAVE
jgi:hypothetical protein